MYKRSSVDISIGQLAVTQNVTLPQQTVRDTTKWMDFKPSLSANLAQNVAKNAQPNAVYHSSLLQKTIKSNFNAYQTLWNIGYSPQSIENQLCILK